MNDKRTRIAGLLAALVMTALLPGCSRETINSQVAEAIGTLGMYENNEPVETPKMKAEREQKESEAAAESAFQDQLDAADRYAASYMYDEAIASLEKIEATELTQSRIEEKIAEYESAKNSLVPYTGDVPHLCFPILIADPTRAFKDNDRMSEYDSTMITVSEFEGILNSLYEKNYVLVDIHEIANNQTDDRGVTMLEKQELLLPPGKQPIIISQDNLDYSGIRNGDGIATALVLDDEGKVKARFTDSGGHDLKGDYDLVPVLDAFVEEHPDFSCRGAKGIVSVSGAGDVFGYQVDGDVLQTSDEAQQTVADIAQQLRKTGWQIACAGYNHAYMNEMSLEDLKADIGSWQDEVGMLTGDVDIMFYPYGAEIQDGSEQMDYMIEQGFCYMCGLWSEKDFTEMHEMYMRQTRRFIDGYALQYAYDYFTSFFSARDILSPDR